MENLKHLIKCYICNKHLLQERSFGGSISEMLHPEHCQTEFVLNNGSRMPVVICITCRDKSDLDTALVQSEIMNNIIDGWQQEQDFLLEKEIITKQQAHDCMSLHRSYSILFKSHGLNDYQVKERLQK